MPSTWQGWVLILGYLILVLSPLLFITDELEAENTAYVWAYLIFVFLFTITLVTISALKGPKAKWRWGIKPEDNADEDY